MIFTQIDKKNNMNVVRYYLCLCIIMNHFNVLNDTALPMLPRIFGGVGSFFAISGFLMFASFEKRPYVKGYLDRRIRRILPPYVLIVLLAAFGLSLLSTLPAYEYFTDWHFYKYLISNLLFMNFLAPSLPGVFESGLNHLDAVNGSLWTMKGEVICYLSVPLVFALIRRHPRYVRHIIAGLIVICFSMFVTLSLTQDGIIAKQFRVFTFFFIGAFLNLSLGYIKKYKWYILPTILLLLYVTTFDGLLHLVLRPFTDSVLVIWCCMIGSWGHFLSRYNSVSYDMYLFHFPIIQVLVSMGVTDLWLSLFIAVAITVVMAAISWRFIGKPILNGRPTMCLSRQ